MKIIESFFGNLSNWFDKRFTPPEDIMKQRVERERYMQLQEAKLDRLKHLAQAEHHRGLAAGAENTIRRIEGEMQ